MMHNDDFIASRPDQKYTGGCHTSADVETERAARSFMRRLEGKYVVLECIVYGSRARRTHTAESDADLAVVLKGGRGDRYAAAGDMARISFDVML